MMSDAQIFEIVFNLFGWLYQINIPAPMRAAIEQQVASGWHNQDPSEQQFMSFLLDLNNQLTQSGDPEMYRTNVWEHFRNEFAAAEQTSPNHLNDKGRLLLVIHGVIESVRPGSTGFASSRATGMPHGGNARPSYAAPSAQNYSANDPDQELRDLEAQSQRMQRQALASATLTSIANMRQEMLMYVAKNGFKF